MRTNAIPSVLFSRVLFFSLNLLLSIVAVTSAAQKEVEISSFYAKVYVAPSTNANFIGLTQKGERYPILGIRESWYYIRFKNANGWVESSQLRVIDPDAIAATAANSVGTEGEAAGAAAQPADGAPTETGAAAPSGERADGAPAAGTGSDSTPTGTVTTQQNQRNSTPTTRTSAPVTRRTTTIVAKPAEKKDSRLRSWFTQQNLPELPPTIVPSDEQMQTPRYFQVRTPTRVLEYSSPQAPILGMAKRGELLALINEGDSWCRVVFADTVGWIENRCGKIIDPANAVTVDFIKIIVVLGGVLIVSIAIILTIMAIRKRKKRKEAEATAKKHMLIVAAASKVIQYTLTNGTTTLERCFGEVGFSIAHARDFSSVKDYFKQQQPDVVLLDYQLDKTIVASMERLCAPLDFAANILFIVYNVPDPASMHPGTVLPKMAFLGFSFSDRDVFKLVTPLLRGSDNETIQKSVQSSALAGNIGEGNLLEVLQFIEIGSKTGCLLIEMEQPFAIICFKNGRIIFAATADKITGKDAIFKVLDLKIGKFRFVLDKRPKESNINLSTLEVLMEWAKAIDEAHGR